MNELTFTTPGPTGMTAYVGDPATMPHPVTHTDVRRWHAFTIDLLFRPVYNGCAYVIPDATQAEVINAFNPN